MSFRVDYRTDASSNASARNKTKQNRNINYVNAIGVGALGGYALKYALPINADEKPLYQSLRAIKLQDGVKFAKANMLKTFENSSFFKQNEGLKLFVEYAQKQDKTTFKLAEKLKKLDADNKKAFKTALKEINQIRKNAGNAYDTAAALATKSLSRTTVGFMGFGVAAGLCFALIYNSFQKIIHED